MDNNLEIGRIVEWVKKDYIIIVICLISILICLAAAYNIGDELEKCNLHWATEFEKLGCGGFDYNWSGVTWEYDFNNKSANTSRTS